MHPEHCPYVGAVRTLPTHDTVLHLLHVVESDKAQVETNKRSKYRQNGTIYCSAGIHGERESRRLVNSLAPSRQEPDSCGLREMEPFRLLLQLYYPLRETDNYT